MPTKLGEYLATGRPVVVTATGDIPKYLHDGVEAFVVEPGDVHSFSEALERALYNPVAAEVGRAGQRLARREFDTVVHMRRLLETIEATR
jgi:glycosyltransferase involved in cell wall biosynthesis